MEPGYQMQQRKGNTAHTHTHTHTHTYKQLHTCMPTHMHSDGQTLLCILTIWVACDSKLFFLLQEKCWELKQDWYWARPVGSCHWIPPPPTTNESSSGGGGWYASLPAVKFLQAFFLFAFQQQQVSGGRFPRFMSPRVASLHTLKNMRWLRQIHFKELRSVQSRVEEESLNTRRVSAAHPKSFFKTISISTIQCLIIDTQRCSKHELVNGNPADMIGERISCGHRVLCSIKQFYFWLKLLSGTEPCSDFVV